MRAVLYRSQHRLLWTLWFIKCFTKKPSDDTTQGGAGNTAAGVVATTSSRRKVALKLMLRLSA